MLRFNALLFFLFLINILFKCGAAKPIAGASDATINETLSLIQQADQIIQNSTVEDAIIVQGISGVGKTPFTKWMTQDNTKLMSVKKKKTGPYLMGDTDNTIGKNILVSATIFPTLYINASSKLAFYDFPGFEDTRGTNFDIATTYAAKGVLFKTKRTKLIFLVDYASVHSLGSRTGFTDLLRYISEFVTDINKFKDSIVIVISKVPTHINGLEVSDEQVIDDVADFINTEVLPILQKESENINLSDKERAFYARALSFISVILTKTGDNYTRIGLFRLPDRDGPFSNISLVQKGKERIEQIIRRLNFTEITANDFNYVIPDKAKINVDKITQEMNNKINSIIGEIRENVESLISTKERNINDVTKLHSEIYSIYEGLSNARMSANDSNIERCVELVEENTINFRNFSLSAIKSYARFLLFLQNVSTNGIERSNANCFQVLKTAINYLDDSQKWYKFLSNLYYSLSDYDVQKNITGCKNALPKVNVNEDDQTTIRKKLGTFFKQCVIKNNEYDHLQNINMDAAKLNVLDRVLNYTLKYSSDLSCDPKNPEKLTLKGRYVKFSDIVHAIIDIKRSQPIKIAEVFSFNKVFIDASLNKTGEKLQLSIMAPIWDVQSEHKIILDGLPGNAQIKALDGQYPSGNGTDGIPGLPGYSAGSFLGIGEVFLNVEKLMISANGGNGGPGQRGGDGANGTDGATFDEFEWHGITGYGSAKGRVDVIYPKKNCTAGGNGGAGGKGGPGGQPGVFFIPLIRNVPGPNISNKTGSVGSNGVGGLKGNAGKPGYITYVLNTRHYSCSGITEGLSDCSIDGWYHTINRTAYPQCNDGVSGITGFAESNTTSETVSFSVFVSTINDYKNYLRSDMMGDRIPANDTFIERFHNLLENKTHEYYDLSTFVNELYNLERQFIRLREEIFIVNELHDLNRLNRLYKKQLLSFFYESLLKRLDQYGNAEQENELLNYLRIAILGKIGSIDDDSNNYLVVDIKKYLENARSHIPEYTKSLREIRRDNQAQQFERIVSEEISRANLMIMEQILPKIDELIVETDRKIRLLLEEVNTLVTKAEQEAREKKDKLHDLQGQLVFKYVLGFLQFGSVFLACAGPAGVAAGAVIGGASTAIQSFAFDNSPLPTYVGKQVLRYTELKEKQKRELSSDIDAAERELDKYKDEYPSNQHLNDIKKKLDEKRAALNSNGAQSTQEIRAELGQLLNDKKMFLEQRKSQTDKGLNKQMKVMNYMSTTVTVGEVLADVHSKIATHQAKIDATSDEMKDIDDLIYKMKKDEQEIFGIIPNMTDMSKYSNLSEFSEIDLVVFTWKLQSKVEDLQFRIKQMSDKFTVREDVTHCISKFKNAIDTMILVYQTIQKYIRESKLAEYFKAINSEVKPTANARLGNDFDKLEFIIKSNLVMEEYENGIRAFKQYVFPLAHFYLHQFSHLSHEMSLEMKNITFLVNDAANRIQKLHDDLEKDQVAITSKYHAYLYPNANFSGSSSFYTWKYDDYKEGIRKLLLGHTVVFESDVKQSRSGISAIKFHEIGVSFKCANSTIQNELNLQLEQFKINMTHLGDSHYRFRDKFYLITHEKVQMIHFVNKNYNGTYTGENNDYAMIKRNYPLLSPYALWEISLQHLVNGNEFDNDFSSLLNYSNEVIDLVLEGYGSYVSNNIPLPDTDVKKYYKRSFE